MRSSAPLRAAEATSRTASPTWHGSVRVLRSMAFRRTPEARTRPASVVARPDSDLRVGSATSSRREPGFIATSAPQPREISLAACEHPAAPARPAAPHNDLALARALLSNDGEAEEMANNHRVIVVGGGFGGLRAARALKRAPVDVTLIDKRNF